MELDVLTEAIDQLAQADPATLGYGEAVIALQHQLARLEAVATKATASFDASASCASAASSPATASVICANDACVCAEVSFTCC